MRIGILGGTFDPVHEGHLALARAAVEQLKLDRLILVPAYRHPLKNKEHSTVASPEARLEMTKLGVKGEARFEVSDCEIKRKDVSYTVDTLQAFRMRYPKPNELFFVTGGDWGRSLNQWKDIDVIFTLAHFIVAKRPGFDTNNLPRGIEFLNFVPLDISSTEVRSRLQKGISVSRFVPQVVLDYIRKHGLYQS